MNAATEYDEFGQELTESQVSDMYAKRTESVRNANSEMDRIQSLYDLPIYKWASRERP